MSEQDKIKALQSLANETNHLGCDSTPELEQSHNSKLMFDMSVQCSLEQETRLIESSQSQLEL